MSGKRSTRTAAAVTIPGWRWARHPDGTIEQNGNRT